MLSLVDSAYAASSINETKRQESQAMSDSRSRPSTSACGTTSNLAGQSRAAADRPLATMQTSADQSLSHACVFREQRKAPGRLRKPNSANIHKPCPVTRMSELMAPNLSSEAPTMQAGLRILWHLRG